MPGPVEAVPAAAACFRSGEARRTASMARGGRRDPVVGFLERQASLDSAAREALTAKRPSWKWRLKGLKRLNLRPEMV